jgi:hypothetical protein
MYYATVAVRAVRLRELVSQTELKRFGVSMLYSEL